MSEAHLDMHGGVQGRIKTRTVLAQSSGLELSLIGLKPDSPSERSSLGHARRSAGLIFYYWEVFFCYYLIYKRDGLRWIVLWNILIVWGWMYAMFTKDRM